MNEQPEAIRFEPALFDPARLEGVTTEEAVADLLGYAARMPASDLFFASHERGLTIALRHMGIYRELTSVGVETGRRFINHVKAEAGMDVAQRMRPQDGRWVCPLGDSRRVDLRINSMPTLYGEDMAIRLLGYDAGLLDLGALGFDARSHESLLNLLDKPSGLILVTGPAGAGKTTTLYACLQYLHDGTRKINTIEDPIEFVIPGIRQSQIHLKIGLDFPELLSSVLRQSPDVIMVGEIRDAVTAETAVRAANTGHLVLATLHAPVAAGAVESMLALGVIPYFLANSLIGVLSQRLVRRLCNNCRAAFDLGGSPFTFDDVRKHLEPGQGGVLYSAPGCEHCHGTGYTDRVGVLEVLRVTREIRRLIVDKATTHEIRDQAVEQGMLDLRRAALLKVAQGVTSAEEVMRVIPTEHLLRDG